MILYSSCI